MPRQSLNPQPTVLSLSCMQTGDSLPPAAETFADNPAVVGYDLLNEPFGNEVTEIAPLYADVAVLIRKHDPAAILFIEPQVSLGMWHARQNSRVHAGDCKAAAHALEEALADEAGFERPRSG